LHRSENKKDQLIELMSCSWGEDLLYFGSDSRYVKQSGYCSTVTNDNFLFLALRWIAGLIFSWIGTRILSDVHLFELRHNY